MPSFEQLVGVLHPDDGDGAAVASKAVYSDLTRGSAASSGAEGVWVKYVARGTVTHHFDGRTFIVRPGEFLFAPERLASELEVRPDGERSTIGLCLFLATGFSRAQNPADEPIIFRADSSALGRLVEQRTAEMRRSSYDRIERGAALVRTVEPDLDAFLLDLSRQFAALPELRSATRHETLRRLHRARAYLHGHTDRAIDSTELAGIAGLSRFHLLRQFKLVFGDPPGAYHRRLRLELAANAVRRDRLPVAVAAGRHGFSDASSFSHAYRRAFGAAPFRPRM